MTEPRADRLPIVVQVYMGEFAVAVLPRDEAGEPIYATRHRDIPDAKIAATLVAQEAGAGAKAPIR